MRTGKVVNGSGALQATLSLPPGTIVMFGEDENMWRAAKLVVVSPAPVRLGGGLELTVTYKKSETDAQEITETVTLPAGHLPIVVDEQALLDCEDASLLGDLHEANILHCLHLRYKAGQYFTRVGNILVSMCPPVDANLKNIDKNAWRRARHDASQRSRAHIFDVAETCLDSVKRAKKNQCCVLLGESGSGKSTCGKQFMNYFVSNGTGNSSDSGLLSSTSMSAVRRIMNAFGHATTKASEDSSRMGLLWQLRMNSKNGGCVGLRVSSMLLEVQRVTHHAVDDRNFHVFHELCMANPQLRKKLQLEGVKARDLKFLRPSTSPTSTTPLAPSSGRYLRSDGVNDADMVAELVKALDTMLPLKANAAGGGELLRYTAAVMHLGEIDFEESEGIKVKPSSAKALSIAAHLLGVDEVVLSDVCTTKSIKV
jgi:myosin heavy subunit